MPFFSGSPVPIHWSMCLSLHQHHTVLITVIAVIVFNWVSDSSHFITLFQNCFKFSNSFDFFNANCIISILFKNLYWILTGITLNLTCQFLGELIFLMCWVFQSMNMNSLSIYLALKNSFHQCFIVFNTKPCICLLFIPKYFAFLELL